MKRKIISLILALALCFTLAVSVSAAGTAFVVDDDGYLTSQEVRELNELAAELYEKTGVGIFFAYTTVDPIQDYDVEALVGDITDYVVMVENETSWYTFYSGRGESIDWATEEALRRYYDETETYAEGVEAYLLAAAECFEGTEDTPQRVEEWLIYDDADLITNSEEMALNEKLNEVSHTYNAQIVIITVESMEGGDIDEFLEFLYDEGEFGYGEEHDGVFLLICMDPREYRILSNGFAAAAIDTGDIDSIGNAFASDLTDGNYAEALDIFVEQCDYYLDGYVNGFPFNFGTNLVIALVIGLLVGLVVATVLKSQLKSVHKQSQANVYVKQGSMQITQSGDYFMYSNVTRTERQQNNSSSGGGSSRSTGGGSF